MTNTTETQTKNEHLARFELNASQAPAMRTEIRDSAALRSIAASNIAILDGIKILVSAKGIDYKGTVERFEQPVPPLTDETVDPFKVHNTFELRSNAREAARQGDNALASRRLLAQIEAEDALNSTEFEMYEQKIREARA